MKTRLILTALSAAAIATAGPIFAGGALAAPPAKSKSAPAAAASAPAPAKVGHKKMKRHHGKTPAPAAAPKTDSK